MKNLKINKRLVATLLSFTMLTTSLVGCSDNLDDNFDYEVLEDGTISCSGKMSYEHLKEYYVVELTVFNKKEIYVVKKYNTVRPLNSWYINVANQKQIYSSNDDSENKEIINLGKAEDYLLYYEMVKDSYSLEDIENLIAKIKEDYEKNKQKALVKNGNKN